MSGEDEANNEMRADLARVMAAQAAREDAARPERIERQHARGRNTARENIAAFADPGSFVEYGGLAQPARKDMEGPADGLVMGTANVDGDPTVLVAYDYTVHAGTQSATNHRKMDRMFTLAEQNRWPLVGWWDGGGARPHDMLIPGRPESPGFVTYARLSGWAPTVALVTGRAFAGQANLSGLSDVVIATKTASMGMAGPPLVEAALGHRLSPEEIGPMDVHEAAGSIDVLVETEAEAMAAARQYLSYFRRPGESERGDAVAPDVMALREVIPENPRRAYDVRKVIRLLADQDSVLELRPRFGRAAVTALARINGRPVGVLANQPMVLGGAMDSPACDKLARFIGLCDAYDIPLIFLCDTPGLMVGPEIEKTALVRHSARILTAAATATVPILTVVLRKAYGLGYYVMGSMAYAPNLLVAWPTAEFGGMGIEGAVNIIHQQELAEAADEETRSTLHARLTDELKDHHTALRVAGRFYIDDVIDPADTRAILDSALGKIPPPPPRTTRKRVVEPW